MEYSLTGNKYDAYASTIVLILVVMEYSLTHFRHFHLFPFFTLNPCCNGILPDFSYWFSHWCAFQS